MPPAWLEWTEYDHERLSEALLSALEQNVPSAVACASNARLLCVEQSMKDLLIAAVDQHVEPYPRSRLDSCLLSLVKASMRSRSFALPFGQLRSLVASPFVLRQLLDLNDKLPHLHSLHRVSNDEAAWTRQSLDSYWPL